MFKAIYACFGVVKKGFIRSCKRFLGFDSLFLFGLDFGKLLYASGQDANKDIYPVSYAMSGGKFKESLRCFLELVINDLDIQERQGWTLMSNEHPRLITIVKKLTSLVEYRHCACHIF